VNWDVKIQLYSLFVVIASFPRVGYNVRVGWLMTSQMSAFRPSWLYFTVEWIREVNTTSYHARHPLYT